MTTPLTLTVTLATFWSGKDTILFHFPRFTGYLNLKGTTKPGKIMRFCISNGVTKSDKPSKPIIKYPKISYQLRFS